MVRVSAADLQRRWGQVQDMALAAPVTVTCKGRDRIILLSIEEYNRLKQRDRQVMTLSDFTADDISALENTRAPAEAGAFDHEVTE
jgi:PHD/YefM family antitoxin component YafN of YafNO toxin-antitoxin module